MHHYHCPYCNALIQHRPRYAGSRVVCSKCQGAFFEPTDPLPGVKPEKAPAFAEDQAEPAAAESKETRHATPDKSETLSKCQPEDMVAELARRGQGALMLFWNPASPGDAGLAYTKNISRQQADDRLIQVAAHVMQSKWPDLHQLILNRLSGS